MTPYSDTIRQWAADDRRAGTLPDADGTGEVGLDPGEAGRRLAVRFTLRIRDKRVDTVRYQVFGCGFTIAACAAAAELAEGRTLTEAAAITPARVDAALAGLPPERDYCATLAVKALQAAVKSAGRHRLPVAATLAADAEHIPRVNASDPLYRRLIDSPAPQGAPADDRHLFACLLTAAAGEPGDLAANLGLNREMLIDLLDLYFPAITTAALETFKMPGDSISTPASPGILAILLAHLPCDEEGWTPVPSLWLARILATRAARPGHLWIAMGLFARPELTAAIRRHLPTLALANHNGMRWKRFLFKQLCEQSGGILCKVPDCALCSDYALCFAGE